MRKISIIALLLAFVMVFAGCNLIEINPERDMQRAVIKIDGEMVTKQVYAEVYSNVYSNLDYQYQLSEQDLASPEVLQSIKDAAIEEAIAQKILEIKAHEYGCYDFTQEELDEIESEIADTLAYYLQIARSSVTGNDANTDLNEEEIEKLVNQEFVIFLENIDFDEESYRQNIVDKKAASKVYEIITKTEPPAESELQSEYDFRVAQQRAAFEDGSLNYESSYASGEIIYYNLGGMRKSRHILIGLPDDVKTQINTHRTNGDDDKADKVLKEELAKIEEEANNVYIMAKEDADFDELIAEYGDDPGMSTDNFYAMRKDSTSFVKEFVDGLFSLDNKGDFTEPIATDFGYHIIYYADEVQEGAVAFDEVKDEISDELIQQEKQTLYSEQMAQWKDEMKIKIYKRRLDFE